MDAAISAKASMLEPELDISGFIFISLCFVLVSIMFMIIAQRGGIGKRFYEDRARKVRFVECCKKY